MIGMMVELTVAPGSTDAYERAFAVQAASVRANEPGIRLYELFKSRTLADSYPLIEMYDEPEAGRPEQVHRDRLERGWRNDSVCVAIGASANRLLDA